MKEFHGRKHALFIVRMNVRFECEPEKNRRMEDPVVVGHGHGVLNYEGVLLCKQSSGYLLVSFVGVVAVLSQMVHRLCVQETFVRIRDRVRSGIGGHSATFMSARYPSAAIVQNCWNLSVARIVGW